MNPVRQRFSLLWLHKKITIPTGIGVIGGIIAVLVFVLTTPSTPEAITYTDLSRNFRVCLLSTTRDAADVNRLWPAVQAASRKVAINAEHVTAPAGTNDELVPYLNSLIAIHCGLIITAGHDLTEPTIAVAKTHPQQHFLIPSPHDTLPNVDSVPEQPDALTTTVVSAAQAATPAPR